MKMIWETGKNRFKWMKIPLFAEIYKRFIAPV